MTKVAEALARNQALASVDLEGECASMGAKSRHASWVITSIQKRHARAAAMVACGSCATAKRKRGLKTRGVKALNTDATSDNS